MFIYVAAEDGSRLEQCATCGFVDGTSGLSSRKMRRASTGASEIRTAFSRVVPMPAVQRRIPQMAKLRSNDGRPLFSIGHMSMQLVD